MKKNDNILSEIEVIENEKGKFITHRIDKLVIRENQVDIIDFKSDRKPPETHIPGNYVKQLSCYKKIIGKKYPDKKNSLPHSLASKSKA